ncbi:conserved hypothetical protein, partial [Ricinus communis]
MRCYGAAGETPEFTDQQRDAQGHRDAARQMEQPAVLSFEIDGNDARTRGLDEFCREYLPRQILCPAETLLGGCNATGRKDDD